MENFTNQTDKIQWFVMNAYAKSEQRVEKLLSGNNDFIFFIPKKYVVKNYFGRVKRELAPLIPNIVFIKSSYAQVNAFQRQYSFVGFVTTLKEGKRTPLVVPAYQMDNFIKVVSHCEEELLYFRPEELELKKGDFVRIIGGEYNGVKGRLLKLKGKRNKRLIVQVPKIMAVAATYIEPEYIQVISECEFESEE